jgi:uncharacterized protein YhbP (UPF0306 family)
MPIISSDTPAASSRSARADDLRRTVLAFLQRHHTMSLATDGPLGLWASTVFYVHIGFDLYFRSNTATRHVQNLIVNARAAATINSDPEDWRAIKGIQLEGSVNPVVDRAENLQVMKSFLMRYPFIDSLWGGEEDRVAPETTETLRRTTFRVTPERLVFYDHEDVAEPRELSGPELEIG